MKEKKRTYEGIWLRKRLGQHLLVDGNFLDEIICSSGIGKEDCIFEIGAGPGNLTTRLLQAAKRVVAVEIDRRFAGELHALVEQFPRRLEVIFDDVLRVNLSQVLHRTGTPWKVLANIPYYITSPLLEMLLVTGNTLFSHLFLTVQKEIALRLCAQPPSKESSSLSLFVAYYAEPSILFDVPRSAFMPPPLVDSAFVQLKLREASPVPAPPHVLFPLIRKAFGQRRKGIKNSLKGLYPGLAEAQFLEIIRESGIDPLSRPQDIPLSLFSTLAMLLEEQK